jgi:hypothetical protein
MKQSAMQKLLEEVILEREKSISVEFRDALDFVITAIETDYKEMEKQQQVYNKEIVDILDNVRYWETCPDEYKVIIEKFIEQFKKINKR